MFNFAEFVTGGIHNRNKIFSIGEFRLNGQRTDCFRSIFIFDENLKDHVERTKSVAGYYGKHTADSLVFDFDGEDLTSVKNEVIKFCMFLYYTYEVPFEYLHIAFSGAKGFHISIPFCAVCGNPEPKENFWQVYKSMAEDLITGFTFADTSIYEIRRIFRIKNTINGKTGLYKIPISFNELSNLTIDEIKELAKQPRESTSLPDSEMSVVPLLNEIFIKWYKHKYLESVTINSGSNKDSSSKRTELLNIIKNGAQEGNRHKALIRLTGMLAEQGFDYDFTLEMLKLWNQRNNPPLPDDRLVNESRTVFNDVKKKNPDEINDIIVYSIKDAEQKYKDYVAALDRVKVNTGYPDIDNKLRGIIPGETLCVIGKTSVGKSAFLQNIGLNYAKQTKEPVLFFSMEMPVESVYERCLQINSGLSGIEIEKHYREESEKIKVNSYFLDQECHNFYTIAKNGLNLKQIESSIKYAEENVYRKKTGLVLIDYLGLVRERGRDLYEQVSKVARGMKDLAKELNVPVIYLSQVTKKFGEYDELELGAARDSGSVDEASDFVLALWKDRGTKPAANDREFNLNLGILKNRKGGTCRIPLLLHKRSLQVTVLHEEFE